MAPTLRRAVTGPRGPRVDGPPAMDPESASAFDRSPSQLCHNPMIRRALGNRQASKRGVASIAHLFDVSPRLFFLELSKIRIEQDEFTCERDKYYTRAFVALYGRVNALMVYGKPRQRGAHANMLLVVSLCITFVAVFSSSVHASRGVFDRSALVPVVLGGGASTIKGEIMFNWGAATRCVVLDINGGVLFTTTLVHDSLDAFYASILSLWIFGGKNELHVGWARYASLIVLGSIGGALFALAWVGQHTAVVGCAGGTVPHMALCVIRTLNDPAKSALERNAHVCAGLTLALYMFVMGGKSTALLAVGGLLVTMFPCYLMSTNFISERADTLLWIGGLGVAIVTLTASTAAIVVRGCI
jgi:hypothetical protein